VASTVTTSYSGMSRLTLDDYLDHYEEKVKKLRKEYGKKPYKNWKKEYKSWTTWEISDHLPVWVELKIDYSNDYLRRYL